MDEINTNVSAEDVISALGGYETPAEQNNNPQPEVNPPEGSSEPSQQQSKNNRAFAEMRVENKQYKDVMNSLQELIGLQGADPATVGKAIQDRLNMQKAQKYNVPVEFMARLNQLEERNNSYEAERLKRDALEGFEDVRKTYNLDENALTEFAEKLRDAGINPFAQKTDLHSQYKILYFDHLLEKAKKEGIEQEAQRAGKAQKYSTKPEQQAGSSIDSADKIDTMASFNAFLNSQKN